VAEQEWNIGKRGAVCAQCNADFAPGTTYFSALFQKDGGFERRDYCAGCFQAHRPADIYYFWKTAPQPEGSAKPARPVVDIEYVFDFFKRLDGDPNPQRVAFRYILALMLTRKKILGFEEKKKDEQGSDYQVFRERRGGEAHKVYEPALNEAEITAVSGELSVLLGLTPPAAKTETQPQQPEQIEASN
jgi:hypothetical protein